uniref:Uncharacterized protein n=1 Tax=Caenorhabditis japonica TaxID=281687 RepID=A0A8R1IC82_CAEJA
MVFETKRRKASRLVLSQSIGKRYRNVTAIELEKNVCTDAKKVFTKQSEFEMPHKTESMLVEAASLPRSKHLGNASASTEDLDVEMIAGPMNSPNTLFQTNYVLKSDQCYSSKTSDKSTQVDFPCENTDSVVELFSDEFYTLKEENIRIKRDIEASESMRINQRTRYLEAISARNRFRRQLSAKSKKLNTVNSKLSQVITENQMLIKMEKKQLPQSETAYSSLSNATSKKKKSKLVIQYIQDVTNEEDICAFLEDFIKFIEDEEGQTCSFRLSVWQCVVLKTRASITRYQIEQMKQVFVEFLGRDVLPPVKTTCQLSNKISGIELYQSSIVQSNGKSVTTIQCIDIRRLMEWILEELSASGQLLYDDYSGEDVVLGIGGDSGGGSTKICLLIGNLRQPNSTKHIVTIAVFDDSDTYENIEKYLQPTLDQLNNLRTIKFVENDKLVIRRIVLKVVGDFKFVSEMLAHRKQSCKFFCPLCFQDNTRGTNTIACLDVAKKSSDRTTLTYHRDAEYGNFGVKMGQGPLLKNVEVKNYLPGMLHLITGLFNKYVLQPIWQYAMSIDNDTDFVIFRDMQRTVKEAEKRVEEAKKNAEENGNLEDKEILEIELQVVLNQFRRINEIVTGCDGSVWKEVENAWESIGASREAFFQQFTGNHVKLILSKEGVNKTRRVFQTRSSKKLETILESMDQLHKIMRLSTNKLLDDTEIEEFEEAIKKFVSCLKDSLPSDSVTLKLHTLVHHSRDVLTEQHTHGRLSEQGIEATHSLFNRLERRFVSFRCKKARYMHIVQELLYQSKNSPNFFAGFGYCLLFRE